MTRFFFRNIASAIFTMLLVSFLLFGLLEFGKRDIATKILGIFSTPQQRASFSSQLGLDAPMYRRYLDWLIGNEWRVKEKIGFPLVTLVNPETGEKEWYAQVNGEYFRWQVKDGKLTARVRQSDASTKLRPDDARWKTSEKGYNYFWGVDRKNNAVLWIKGAGKEKWVKTETGIQKQGDGPREYIPLRKGLIRGDPGQSLRYGRPVAEVIMPRLLNSVYLAAIAFTIIIPLALLLGILAGIQEGRLLDRLISVTGLTATATPEFVSGIFLIMIFGLWLDWVPAVAVLTSDDVIFSNPSLLVLPVLTLTATELGYIARMTRASLVEVMDAPYIRTAIAKGMPYSRVVFKHAVRNALMAPITIVMLHINWLVGGLVVVELVFGLPGLGSFIFEAAIFNDFNSTAAAAIVTVIIAVVTRMVGDLAYTLLNPRVRYQ